MVHLIGVLNLTPDSFSDGGKFLEPAAAIAQARQLIADGAVLVDVGGQATNPFVEPIAATEEWSRLAPTLPQLLQEFPGRITLDTFNPLVAENALKIDQVVINDVTAFRNQDLVHVVARYQAPCIVCHLPLAAISVDDAHKNFRLDSAQQVLDELMQQRRQLLDAGVKAEDIWLDPGIGFGKSMKLNWELLRFPELVPVNQTVVIGFSRKRFLATDPKTGKPIEGADKFDPQHNIAAAKITIAASKAHNVYLRVHEPKLYKDLLVT